MPPLSTTLAPQLLTRDRQIVTRFQEHRIRTTFPFLSLPPELRIIVYNLCLNFDGIVKFFDRYYAKLKDCKDVDAVRVPRHLRRTPAILLVCRQVFSEAITVLKKKEVLFNHGLLDIKGIKHLMRPHVLRNVGSISITVKGHPMLKTNILRESWLGYMDLISELAVLLSTQGHQLKKLLIDLEDNKLAEHTSHCWHAANSCDFRDNLKAALNQFRMVRGVGCVEIRGVDPVFARELKIRMESKGRSFLDLPGEIRNKIYKYAANISDITSQVRKTMNNWVDHTSPPPYPDRLTTPTVLLLNKQIFLEASSIIYNTSVKIVLPLDHNMQKQADVPKIDKFVTGATFQKVEHLTISIESWEWIYSLQSMIAMLAGNHNLKSFKLSFKDSLKSTFMAAGDKKYPDLTLHTALSAFTSIRGVDHVSITGDLPTVYAQPLAEIMQTPSGTNSMTTLRAVCGNGSITDTWEGFD